MLALIGRDEETKLLHFSFINSLVHFTSQNRKLLTAWKWYNPVQCSVREIEEDKGGKQDSVINNIKSFGKLYC